MQQRLQKVLAAAGVGSRRHCEELIAAGRVTVNGNKVTTAGVQADPDVDDIRVDRKKLPAAQRHVYLLLNKPTGFVCTVRDRHAERTVMELLKGVPERVVSVGRLDADSAGLLIFTNDGELTQALTHPSHEVPRTYRAVVDGEVDGFAAADLRQGIMLEEGMTRPAQVEWVDYDEQRDVTVVDITITEGRNRQVRRMFEVVGHRVLALTRIAIGSIQLTGLAPGTWRKLRADEIEALRTLAASVAPLPAPAATEPDGEDGDDAPAE